LTQFDTQHHCENSLHIADSIHNWLADFFDNHFHCTMFEGELSTLLFRCYALTSVRNSGIAVWTVRLRT